MASKATRHCSPHSSGRPGLSIRKNHAWPQPGLCLNDPRRGMVSSRKNTLSMSGGEGEEFVPSLNGRRKHSYPGSPLCGLLLKYLIRQHHLSTVYLHVPARQPAHSCWIRFLTSCWFGSIHRSEQQVPEPKAGRETGGRAQQREDEMLLPF